MHKPTSSQPRSWEELVALKDFLSDCDPVEMRLSKELEAYDEHKRSVGHAQMVENIREKIETTGTALIDNDFPYTRTLEFLPKVQQYCLWSINGPLSIDQVTQLVERRFPTSEWFYMVRKVGYKSVPEIWHCHVFVRGEK